MKYFETRFMEEANEFLAELAPKMVKKILYNIDLAEQTNDSKLFKKLQNDIWEFRTKFDGLQIRLLAFWDKSDNKETLVIATHGFKKRRLTKYQQTKLAEPKDLETNTLTANLKIKKYGNQRNQDLFTYRNERQVYR